MTALIIAGSVIAGLIIWVAADILRGALTKDAPRKPSDAGDTADYSFSGLQKAVWRIEHPHDRFTGRAYVRDEEGDGPFSWKEVCGDVPDVLTEELLLECIKPAADYMAKRYDCSDFRAIWLCKLRYALAGSREYGHLLTPRVDNAVREALADFKYWITSGGADSMCFYSENHQMVFAVSEYFAGSAYPDALFSIDGRTGSEHADIAAARMNSWFDQRCRYGFSEFLSSNYLAVDIGALSMLLTYCADAAICRRAETVLNMLFLDYALQMYDCAFSGPAGRNYARNNTSFMASTASHVIVDRVWNTGETDLKNWYRGFPYLFISLTDSGRYRVPDAIVDLGRDNAKGVIRTTSGLDLSEMKQLGLIGLSDSQLMFQLGMGALSNREVIENTLTAMDRYDLVHNNFVSGFKFFNIRLLRLLGLTGRLAAGLDPFPNGMAIQRNEVCTYCCEDYKLSTNQMYFPGSFGAQQLQQMACLPGRINVFTANPMRRKEFQGYGVAPCACQHMNCMLSVFHIPKGRIPLATGDTRHYTSTYFPEEKFDEVITDGCYVFGRIRDTYIALIGASPFRFAAYADRAEFEKKIACDYEFYEGEAGPYVDSFRLKDPTKGFDLRQEGDIQFTVYELGRSRNETFAAFMERVRNNRIVFTGNVLTYATRSHDLSAEVTYELDYSGSFTVNGTAVSTVHDRYDSRFVKAARGTESFSVEHGGYSYTFRLFE